MAVLLISKSTFIILFEKKNRILFNIAAYVFYVVELIIHAFINHRQHRVKVFIDNLIDTFVFIIN